MTWLTENPWPLMIALGAAAIACWLTGSPRARQCSIACVALGVGLFFLERALISPGEEIEAQLEVLLDKFKQSDIDGISAVLASDRSDLVQLAAQGLELVKVEDSFHIGSVESQISPDQQTAVVYVRANGNLRLLKHGSGTRHIPTYWKTRWKREDGTWKLASVTRLNPANGQEIGILSAQ